MIAVTHVKVDHKIEARLLSNCSRAFFVWAKTHQRFGIRQWPVAPPYFCQVDVTKQPINKKRRPQHLIVGGVLALRVCRSVKLRF